MLALVSSSSASAIGRLVRLKNVTSCLTPSSKTLKSLCVEVGDVVAGAVGDGDVQRDELDAGAEAAALRRLPAAGGGGAGVLRARASSQRSGDRRQRRASHARNGTARSRPRLRLP